jgi:hypothetical protein
LEIDLTRITAGTVPNAIDPRRELAADAALLVLLNIREHTAAGRDD